MGWKTRGGRRYYYRSRRVGDRVETTYHGSGEVARTWAEIDATDRELRKVKGDQGRAKRERAGRRESKIVGACKFLATAAEAIIEAAGYHRHHRGPWRRRRTMTGETSLATTTAAPARTLAERYEAGDRGAWDEVQGRIDAAQKGDPKAASKLAPIIRASPKVADRVCVNIARIAEDALIRRAYGKDTLALAEGARHRLAEIRAELAGPNPSPVERLLAERAAVCWFDCYLAEYRDIESGDRTIRQADFSARQRDRAHRRYLSALKALAAVRKLPIVAVQVNMNAVAPAVGGRDDA